MRAPLVIAAFVAVAASCDDGRQPSHSPATASGTAAASQAATTVPGAASAAPTHQPGAPEPVRVAGVKAACKSDVGGPDARVRVWRRGEMLQALELQPGPSVGMHAPWVYFDPDGKEVVRVPNRPVVKDSPEAKEAVTLRERATRDAVAVESLDCKTWLSQPLFLCNFSGRCSSSCRSHVSAVVTRPERARAPRVRRRRALPPGHPARSLPRARR